MSMKRRDFLKTAIPGALAGGVLLGCKRQEHGPSVQTQPHLDWRMASSYTRSLDILYGAAELFVKRVGELTDGRFRIRLYPAGELVPGLQVLDAVQQGTVQCGQSASYYYTGKNPVFAFDTCVPFGLTTRQQNAWLYQGGGIELLRTAFSDFNIVQFPAGNSGGQMGGWFRKEIPSLNALRGLKMRIPGLGGEVMSRLGVTVQVLVNTDAYMALERGALDATEWVGPYDDEKLGFYKIAKNYYYPGWWEPSATVSHYVNKSAWERLPRHYQQAVETASAEANVWMTSAYDARNPEALDRLLANGVQLRRFPDDSLQEAERVSLAILEERAAADVTYNNVYTHWKKFRAQSYRWFNTTELAYASFAYPRAD